MFTGLVEAVGSVVDRVVTGSSVRLRVAAPGSWAGKLILGESIAVSGCCLTAAALDGERVTFDLLAETEARTNLKECKPGALVNLERSLRADSRLGGHFVTGHIDGTGKLLDLKKTGADYGVKVALAPEHAKWMVPKGCVAIDGVSLTVADVGKDFFSAWLIPHTWEHTAWRSKKAGDLLNLEFDLLAKYSEKILAERERGR